MPLDQTDYRPIVIDTKPDLSLPTLEGLAWLLRHPTEWPADHTWDFGTFLLRGEDFLEALEDGIVEHPKEVPLCGTVGCAGGIAWLMWGDGEIGHSIDVTMCDLFDIDPQISFEIFSRGASDHHRSAAQVADRIDDYLAGRPIRE